MPYSHILFQVEESGIAVLTVNRPQKLNALSAAVIDELSDAFGSVASHSTIRALIVTGAGEKAFVAGADIAELAELSALEMLLSGDPVTAAEAHRIGLVNAVVPQAELMEHCRAWLGKVLTNGPAAAALVMDAVDAGLENGLEAGLRYEAAAFGMSAATE